MVIYLEHPVHGTKVATSEMEADYDKRHGWHRTDSEKDDTNALKKRGRPAKEVS